MNNNDSKIKELMEKVELQKAGLGPKPKAVYTTNCIVEINGRTCKNLNIMTKSELVDCLSYILESNHWANEARKRLGLSEVDAVLESGYSAKDYEADFKIRLSILNYNERKQKLDQTEAKLKALMSEDARTANALEDLEKSI
jgi:hypothetical protein